MLDFRWIAAVSRDHFRPAAIPHLTRSRAAMLPIAFGMAHTYLASSKYRASLRPKDMVSIAYF